MLLILGNGGTLPINNNVINDLANGILTPAAGWVVMILMAALFGIMTWLRDARRRASGLVAPPVSLTVVKIVAVAVAGSVVVLICNVDRGVLEPIRGVPWVVLIVLAVLALWTALLGRTKFGRYVYAIGGNAEAARRAGVNLALIRTTAFMLASFTAGIAGVVYASRLRSVSTALDGGTLVLYAVAAAVIGGTSLFGGRGKAIHGVLGGLVIAAIDNGMGLQGYSAAAKYVGHRHRAARRGDHRRRGPSAAAPPARSGPAPDHASSRSLRSSAARSRALPQSCTACEARPGLLVPESWIGQIAARGGS